MAAKAGSTAPAASQMGEARVILGDSLLVLQTLAANSVDAIVTDPPHEVLKAAWDSMPRAELWVAALRVLKPGGRLVVIGAPKTYDLMVAEIRKAGFVVEDMWTWIFTTGMGSAWRCRRSQAPICVAAKPGSHIRLNVDECRLPVDEADRRSMRRIDTLRAHGRRKPGVYDSSLDSNVAARAPFQARHGGRHPPTVMLTEALLGHYDRFFLIPIPRGGNGHPTPKPVALMTYIVRLAVPPGGLVLDPFAGGGSTGVAAVIAGRRAVLIEREPRFATLATKNIAAAQAGKYAKLRIPLPSGDIARDIGPDITSDHEGLPRADERASLIGDERALDQKRMATDLGVDPRTIRRLDAVGAPYMQVGRHRRYDRAEYRGWLKKRGEPRRVLLPRSKLRKPGRAGPANVTGRTPSAEVPARARHAARRRGTGEAAHGRSGRGDQTSRGVDAPGGGARESRLGAGADSRERDEATRVRDAADAARLFADKVGGARGRRAEHDDEADDS